jgi:hypothetical protein
MGDRQSCAERWQAVLQKMRTGQTSWEPRGFQALSHRDHMSRIHAMPGAMPFAMIRGTLHSGTNG